jgi:hypothetical protein
MSSPTKIEYVRAKVDFLEHEVKGVDLAVEGLTNALGWLRTGKLFPAGLSRYYGRGDQYKQVGREIREAVRLLRSAKKRLESQAKIRRHALMWEKRKLRGPR